MEAEGELVSDMNGDLGVPELVVMREAIDPGTEEWDKLLLGRGGLVLGWVTCTISLRHKRTERSERAREERERERDYSYYSSRV